MVTIVFTLAVANLGLGFALAVAIDRLPFPTLPRFKKRGDGATMGEADGVITDGQDLAAAPDDWGQKLKAAEIEPASMIERLLWIAKLETHERRERLVALDRDFFHPTSPQTITSDLQQEAEAFQGVLDRWLVDVEAEKETSEELAGAFEEVLLDQSFQLRSCLDGLADEDADDTARQLAVCMSAVNALRDRVDALLCRLLTEEERLDAIPTRYQTFGERDTLTHLGLASLFDQWWADDPDHVRLVSLVMLDLDRFDLFAQRIGTARGDVALNRFGDMLHDLLRKDRGYDRVARYSGQRFVMFLGDTSSKNASKGAERIRQTIEATSFKLGEETSEVTASLAIVQVSQKDGPGEFIPKLESTLAEAKKAGRNCSFVATDDGAEHVELPQYQVNVHVIELDEEHSGDEDAAVE